HRVDERLHAGGLVAVILIALARDVLREGAAVTPEGPLLVVCVAEIAGVIGIRLVEYVEYHVRVTLERRCNGRPERRRIGHVADWILGERTEIGGRRPVQVEDDVQAGRSCGIDCRLDARAVIPERVWI